MLTTNRRWQNHLRSKGIHLFFLDRLRAHACSSSHTHQHGAFHFPIEDADADDELTRAFFEFTEDFPCQINIEVTSHCDLKCIMCHHPQMERRKMTMKEPLYRKIIDEIALKSPYTSIHFFGIGESMLDVRLFDRIAYALGRGLRNTVLCSHGGLLLVKDNYKKVADAGLAQVGIDIDGFRKESYEKIRVGANLEQVKEGVIKLHAYIRANRKNRTRVTLKYHIYKGLNDTDDDLVPFIEWCKANDFEYAFDTLHDWAGLRKDIPTGRVAGIDGQHGCARQTPCVAVWTEMFIGSNGTVHLCFEDVEAREPMGDINLQSIEDVWTGKMLEKRMKHARGDIDGICVDCDAFTAVGMPMFGSPLYPGIAKETPDETAEQIVEPRTAAAR